MLNYAIDPAVLKPLTPLGTELDSYEGKFFVSVVGFLFLNTKFFGCGIPFHRNFEEVNLRFYVRRNTSEGWRRGVVFVRELVPRLAISSIARTVYGEPYTAFPMRHRIERSEEGIAVEYGWYRNGRWEGLHAEAQGNQVPCRRDRRRNLLPSIIGAIPPALEDAVSMKLNIPLGGSGKLWRPPWMLIWRLSTGKPLWNVSLHNLQVLSLRRDLSLSCVVRQGMHKNSFNELKSASSFSVHQGI